MENQEKEAVRSALRDYVAAYPSQTKAAESLEGVSAGTVSQIISGKYEKVSDKMWNKLAAQISSVAPKQGWQLVETQQWQEITFALNDAQDNHNVTWVVSAAGSGKTTTSTHYAMSRQDAYYILCDEDMLRGDFLSSLAKAVGVKVDGLSIRAKLDKVVNYLYEMECPLLIFDEADKLKDSVMHYFIQLYNRLEDECGIIFLSTDYICTRIQRGLNYNKKGYNELHSRIGRKFYEVADANANDVYSVCVANGLNAKRAINGVIADAQSSEFDLRRVKKAVHRAKRMANK